MLVLVPVAGSMSLVTLNLDIPISEPSLTTALWAVVLVQGYIIYRLVTHLWHQRPAARPAAPLPPVSLRAHTIDVGVQGPITYTALQGHSQPRYKPLTEHAW